MRRGERLADSNRMHLTLMEFEGRRANLLPEEVQLGVGAKGGT